MNIRMGLAIACVASMLVGPAAIAQQAEEATPPAKAAVPPAKAAPATPALPATPSAAAAPTADPAGTGGTPTGKQIYAKDRSTATDKCKSMCPNGGTLTPSIPPSDYWYCTCKGVASQ